MVSMMEAAMAKAKLRLDARHPPGVAPRGEAENVQCK
jgi:hypothetical protein